MAISRLDMERQLRNMGGRIGFQEGGIMPRLNQLGSGVSSAEQMLQGINQRLQSAESSLGSGSGMQLPEIVTDNLGTFPGNPNRKPPLLDKIAPGFKTGQPMGQLFGSNKTPSLEELYPNAGQQGQVDNFLPMRGGAEMMSGIPAASYADGGIASLQEPRQRYFLGKLVRKAKKAVKKVVKSPVGKAALLGGLGYLGAAKLGGLGGLKSALFGQAASKAAGPFSYLQGSPFTKGLLGKLGLTKGGGSMGLTGLGKIASIGGLSGLAGLLAAQEAEDDEEFDISKVDRGEGLDIDRIVRLARMNDPQFRFLPGAEFTTAFAEGGEVKELTGDDRLALEMFGKLFEELSNKEKDFIYYKQNMAYGGRIGKQEGGGVGSLAMNKENVKQKFVSDEAGALPKKGGGVTPEDMGKLKESDFDSEEDYQRYLRQLNRKAEGGSPVTDDDLKKVVKDFNKQAELTGQPFMTLKELKQILGDDIKKSRKYKVGKAEGGLMNLGGMEMDLRGGGFVPLGAKEKADDVPARLSKNEFVMTADAVRAAGGGSVDKGADKMYNLMKDLEAQV